MSDFSSKKAEMMVEMMRKLGMEEDGMKYMDPISSVSDPEPVLLQARIKRGVGFRLPCRLSSPLISVPQAVSQVFLDNSTWRFSGLNQATLDTLVSLREELKFWDEESGVRYYRSLEGMEIWSSTMTLISDWIGKRSTGVVKELNSFCKGFANWATTMELRQITMRDELMNETSTILPDPPAFLTFIVKLRARMTQKIREAKMATVRFSMDEFGVDVVMKKNGYVHILPSDGSVEWRMCLADRWVAVYRDDYQAVIVEPMPYFDYYSTKVEILHNMDIISSTEEYRSLSELMSFFRLMILNEGEHSHVVRFMKSYEGFMNMTADFRADDRCSIGSYIDTINGLIDASESICKIRLSASSLLMIVFGSEEDLDREWEPEYSASPLALLARATRSMTPIELLEASSLHKFCFFAIIDERKGVKKFLARTHTPRTCDPSALESMRALFNKDYSMAYYKKHKRLPSFLADQESLDRANCHPAMKQTLGAVVQDKLHELNKEIKLTGTISESTQPLAWWYDLRPYDSEDSKSTGDPIEMAKDKRSAKCQGSYTGMDTEKELESIITSVDFQAMDILQSINGNEVQQSVEIIHQGSRMFEDPKTTILKEKEKEQKDEGRLFGMFTTSGKQGVSSLMAKAEHVLSYFDGNLMTPPDKERKMHLHWMAQSLLDDKNYAVLADIEGHNQSMQWINTCDLVESIGLCHGEHGWNQLSKLFSELNIYYAEMFGSLAYLSKGQLGGIEGWFNPIWTLHTLLVTKLLPHMTEVVLESTAVYSDDIAMVISNPMDTMDAQDKLLRLVKHHYRGFGMTLKLMQTVVSKYRITMLRQHYMVGIRADSALKRMLSASAIGSSIFHSDEIEASGISSAVSSSLELANAVRVQTLLKWYRCSCLVIRGFIAAMCTPIDGRVMNEKNFSPATVQIYKDHFAEQGSNDLVWIVQRLSDLLAGVDSTRFSEWAKLVNNYLNPVKLSDSERDSLGSRLLERLSVDSAFKMVLMARMIFPVDLGGCNVQFLESMVLTGVRDGVSRNYSIFLSLCPEDSPESRVAEVLLENALGGRGHFFKGREGESSPRNGSIKIPTERGLMHYHVDFEESVLVGQEWPNAQRTMPPNELIRSKLLRKFKSICKNESLDQLLGIDGDRRKFKAALASELGGKFCSKVAKFYMDVSVFTIVDKILGKVENTSSLLKTVSRFEDLCSTIARISVEGPRLFLRKPVFSFGSVNRREPIQEYLFRRRCIMFPEVSFMDVIEPEVNSVIKVMDPSESENRTVPWAFHLVMASGMAHSNGQMRYLPPLYGAEALYKGGLRDPMEGFSHYREALLIKCVSVTKWIIFRSDPLKYDARINSSNSIINAANLCLSTLNYMRFEVYEKYVAILARSEVAHRIPILDGKTGAVCRSLPSVVPTFRVIVNQNWVYGNDLKDSNIHFDYWRMRPIVAEAIASSIREPPRFNSQYSIKLFRLIHDMQLDYVDDRPEVDVSSFKYSHRSVTGDISMVRIQWISMNLPEILDGSLSATLPKVTTDPIASEGIEGYKSQLILDYYRSLRRDNLWELNPIWSDSAWAPFLKKYHNLFIGDQRDPMQIVKSTLVTMIQDGTDLLKKKLLIKTDDIMLAKVIDRFKEDVCDDDDVIVSLKSDVEKQLSLVLNSNSKREEATRTVKDTIVAMGLIRRRLLRLIFMEIVLNNCLVISGKSGKPMYNREQSILLAEHLIKDMAFLATLSDREAILAEICCSVLTAGTLSGIAVALLSEVETYVNDLAEDIEMDESILVSSSYVDAGNHEPDTDCEDLRLPTMLYSIESMPESQYSSLRSAIQLRANMIRNNGSADVYQSPFHSDIYQPIKSLLRSLVEHKIIGNHTFVLDIAAGRGECAFAMDEMGIAHKSINRRDEYAMMRHWTNVEYLDEYDLAGKSVPDIIPVLLSAVSMENRVILADISHLGRGSGAFIERMIDMMEMASTIVIRYAAVSSGMSEIMRASSSAGMCSFLAMCGEGQHQSPTIYLVLQRIGLGVDSPIAVDDGTQLTRRLMHDWRRLFLSPADLEYTRGPMACSVMEDLGVEGPVDSWLVKKIEAIEVVTENKYMSTAVGLLGISNACFLNDKLVKSLLSVGVRLGIDVRTWSGGTDRWHSEQKVDKIGEFSKYYRSHDWFKITHWLDLRYISYGALKVLRQYHPIYAVRRLANAMVMLNIPDRRSESETNRECVSRLFGTGKQTSVSGNSRTKNLIDAFCLLCKDAMARNPTAHRRILELAYYNGVLKRKRYNDILYYRRCMGGLYDRISRLLSQWSIADDWSNSIDVYVRNAFVRQGALRTSHAYTVDLKSRNVRTLVHELSNDDASLARVFLECADSMLDFDKLAGSMIANAKDQVAKESDKIDMGDLRALEMSLEMGNLDGLMSTWVVPDTILSAEDAAMVELRSKTEVREGESEEEYEQRLKTLAMYSVMAAMDEDFGDY